MVTQFQRALTVQLGWRIEMDRLTDKAWANLDPWECCGQDDFCKRGCHEDGGCLRGCSVPKTYFRLAEIEDKLERGELGNINERRND